MSTLDRNAEIKSYFQSGDIPTQDEFGILIDAATTDPIANERLPMQMDLTAVSGDGTSTLTAQEINGKLNGDGSKINNINADNINAGTLANVRLPEQMDLTQVGVASQVTAKTFVGDGSALSNLDADQINVGTVDNARLPEQMDLTQIGVASKVTAKEFAGDGSALINLDADAISTGTLVSARLPEQINLTVQGDASKVTAAEFEGNGRLLSGLNADNISTGTLANARINKATSSQQGIARFSDSTDLENGSSDSMVSAAHLKSAMGDNRSYVDNELALLQAGIKFKRGVATVFTLQYDMSLGIPAEFVNGYQIQPGDRVLFTAQNNPVENKVWIAPTEGDWIEAEDFDNTPEQELFVGLSVEVLKAGDLAHSIWSVIEIIASSDTDGTPTLIWQKRNDINNYQAGDGISINGLQVSSDVSWLTNFLEGSSISSSSLTGVVSSTNLPSATNSNKGIVELATATEVENGTDPQKAVTPQALSQADLLSHLFKFEEDIGQTVTADMIPDGKVLVLYQSIS